MKIAKVDVTLEDIQHGERTNCHRCPIARALMRALPDAVGVRVNAMIEAAFVNDDPKRRRYYALAPPEAIDFMNAFDGGHAVSPFCFEVTLFPPF